MSEGRESLRCKIFRSIARKVGTGTPCSRNLRRPSELKAEAIYACKLHHKLNGLREIQGFNAPSRAPKAKPYSAGTGTKPKVAGLADLTVCLVSHARPRVLESRGVNSFPLGSVSFDKSIPGSLGPLGLLKLPIRQATGSKRLFRLLQGDIGGTETNSNSQLARSLRP